jgi:hypothetical protein
MSSRTVLGEMPLSEGLLSLHNGPSDILSTPCAWQEVVGSELENRPYGFEQYKGDQVSGCWSMNSFTSLSPGIPFRAPIALQLSAAVAEAKRMHCGMDHF